MSEISKGVWVPQGTTYTRYEYGRPVEAVAEGTEEVRAMLSCAAAAPVPKPRGKVIINPEDECTCLMDSGYQCAECHEEEVDCAAAFKEVVRDAGRVEKERQAAAKEAETLAALEKERAAMAAKHPRALEPVAAFTHAGATMGLPRREAGVAVVAPEPSSLEKAFKNHPDAAEDYCASEWNEVPDVKCPEPFVAGWYNCVKRYRFVKVGHGPLGGGPRLIIEVELMSGTTLRNIIKLSKVKSILTKGHSRDTHGYVVIEEVIIDMRHGGYGYNPDQVKLRFAGGDNALAFHMALEAAL